MRNSLTAPEQECLDTLVSAWNLFVKLPTLHEWDSVEFMHAIHRAQDIVISRMYLRLSKPDALRIPDDPSVPPNVPF